MPRIDCGIDIGSTNLKVIFVANGDVVFSKMVPSPRVHDAFGPVTDPLAMVSLLEEMIIEGWQAVGEGVPLRSIAAAGVGEDGVGVNAEMMPTGLCLPWFDMRAKGEAEELAARLGYLQPVTGIAIGPDRTAAKWLWLHRNRPAELEKARAWIALTDFPGAWWSGNAFMSASLAARTACFDVFRRRWLTEILETVHAPELPHIVGSGTVVGRVQRGALLATGAADADTLVVAGGHDHPMAAAVIRRYDPSAIVDSLGTANLLYGETKAAAPGDRDLAIALSLVPDGRDGIACLGVLEMDLALAASGATPDQVRAFLNHDRLPGAPPRTPEELAETEGEAGIRRALERECFSARHIVKQMATLGVPSGPIYATGGRSRSRGFLELRASIFGREICAIDEMELSALGAAQAAADAATAKPGCILREKDIKTVEPCADWVEDYAKLQTRAQAGKRDRRPS